MGSRAKDRFDQAQLIFCQSGFLRTALQELVHLGGDLQIWGNLKRLGVGQSREATASELWESMMLVSGKESL